MSESILLRLSGVIDVQNKCSTGFKGAHLKISMFMSNLYDLIPENLIVLDQATCLKRIHSTIFLFKKHRNHCTPNEKTDIWENK